MHPDKFKNIQNLTPQDRYGYLIRKAANFEEVWLIQDNGKYVTLGDKEEQITIPIWPEKEFADLMLTDDWKNYSVKCMNVYDFIEWLDELKKEGYKIAGFPSNNLNSVVVSADEIKNHLVYELQLLGFVKKTEVPLGEHKWLTVVSKEEQDGTELVLEPLGFPPAATFQKALFEAGIPFTAFNVDDVEAEYKHLTDLGVSFSIPPTVMGTTKLAVFNDTCGNNIQLFQVL